MEVELELSLGIPVEEPKIFVLHRARACPFLGVIDDTHASAVVDVYWGGRLWVSELFRVRRIIFASCTFKNNAPSSASAAEAATSLSIVQST